MTNPALFAEHPDTPENESRQKEGPQGKLALRIGLSIIILSGIMGIILDLDELYSRRSKLKHVADAAAVAGARELNGEVSGLTAAQMQATLIAVNAGPAQDKLTIPAEEKIWFGPSPKGPWSNLGIAQANPGTHRFIRVEIGAVVPQREFMPLIPQLSPSPISSTASGVAVAGKNNSLALSGKHPEIRIYP